MNRNLKWCAICGIVGPILFTVVVVTVGLLHPGYNHVTQYISELGASGTPNAIIMNTVGESLLGLLVIAFAFGLHQGIGEGKGSKIGPALVAVGGAGLVAVAIFPCDPGCVNVTITGVMHVASARVRIIATILAPLLISLRLKKDSLWQGYRLYSVATSIAGAIVYLLLLFVLFKSWNGAVQRILLGVQLLWIEIMAIKLLSLSTRSSVSH